jgi:hypothetical protein
MKIPVSIVAVVLVLFVLGASLSWIATRLDILHARVAGTRETLQTQLTSRSAAVLELAAGGVLDPATSLVVADAANRARTALTAAGEQGIRSPAAARAQSTLTNALQISLSDPDEVAELAAEPQARETLADVLDAARRVELAHRFHDDAVTLTLQRRTSAVVRIFHLAGHAPLPEIVHFADAPPTGLADILAAAPAAAPPAPTAPIS